jgi:hypothetical protein
VRAVAAEYEDAAVGNLDGWAQLLHKAQAFCSEVHEGTRGVCSVRFAVCVTNFAVRTVDQPYETADDLARIILDGAYPEPEAPEDWTHPVWTHEEWAQYLQWHDAVGHVESGYGFDPDGELRAFTVHVQGETEAFAAALFAQQIAPIFYALCRGSFPAIRAALPGPETQGLIDYYRRSPR